MSDAEQFSFQVGKYHLPTWAKWVALDDSGEIWVYENRPRPSPVVGQWFKTEGRNAFVCGWAVRPALVDWRKMIIEVNKVL